MLLEQHKFVGLLEELFEEVEYRWNDRWYFWDHWFLAEVPAPVFRRGGKTSEHLRKVYFSVFRSYVLYPRVGGTLILKRKCVTLPKLHRRILALAYLSYG